MALYKGSRRARTCYVARCTRLYLERQQESLEGFRHAESFALKKTKRERDHRIAANTPPARGWFAKANACVSRVFIAVSIKKAQNIVSPRRII